MTSTRRAKLRINQLNMHHCKGATALIDSQMQVAQTKNQKMVMLLQEPWIRGDEIRGLNPLKYNVYCCPGKGKQRTCIVGSKDLDLVMLPHFCDGDLTVVLLNSQTEGTSPKIILCSGYFPYDGNNIPGTTFEALVAYAEMNEYSIIAGCDANAHHTLWGSTDINDRGVKLLEYIGTTNLFLVNRGNKPTFVNKNREEVIDITLASTNIQDLVGDWRVSNRETLSDHREICFNLKMGVGNKKIFRNPRNTNWPAYGQHIRDSIQSLDTNPPLEPISRRGVNNLVDELTNILQEAFTDR